MNGISTILVPVKDIRIGQRHRKDLGDLQGLAESVREVGLLQPIGVTQDLELVFGERRLRACRDLLGLETVEARIIDLPSIVVGEYVENQVRKDFSVSELYSIVKSLRGFSHGGDRRPGQGRNGDVARLTTAEAAKRVGWSKDQFYRVERIMEAGIPELIEALDQGNVSVSAAAAIAEAEPEMQRRILTQGDEPSRWAASQVRKQRRLIRISEEKVADPFCGSRTSGIAALQLGRSFHGIETAPQSCKLAEARLAIHGKAEPAVLFPTVEVVRNSVAQGDCLDLIPRLPIRSVNLVVTSPPYGEQRKGLYRGVPDHLYPEFTLRWVSALRDKLADDGSVLIVIRPDLKQGVIKDYVLRSRLALRDAGWQECETLIWHKPDGGACMGSTRRPRRTYEEILWFAKTNDPFIDPKACGGACTKASFGGAPRPEKRLKGQSKDRPRQDKRIGRLRLADVIRVPVAKNPRGVGHPAMFPVELAEVLIRTFSPKGATVLDPFCGAGNALLAAKRLGREFYGFDLEASYCELARGRLEAASSHGADVTLVG